MKGDAELVEVLRHYPPDCQPDRVETLGWAGGFSGACFWRLHALRGTLCARRWPAEGPSPEQLARIHAVLAQVERKGFALVPGPIVTRSGATIVTSGGRLWELARWMPGAPDTTYPLLSLRLEAALAALASFHLAAATGGAPMPSPALAQRLQRIERLTAGELERLTSAARPEVWPEGMAVARRHLELFPLAAPGVERALRSTLGLRTPLLPCIRDIWSEHVLFVGNEVSGLIDFGAMRMESPAGDVARLLGSLVGDDVAGWQRGLAAYQTVRPLSPAEREQVAAFDRSSVLLSGLNWIEWIYCDRRRFADLDTIRKRLKRLVQRLEHLAQEGL